MNHVRSTLIFFLLTFFSFSTFSQSKISEKVIENQSIIDATETVSVFTSISKEQYLAKADLMPSKYDLFKIDHISANQVVKDNNDVLRLEIPHNGKMLSLDLVKANIFSPDFKVRKASDPKVAQKIDLGVQYWGKINGDDNSMAAISFSKNALGGVLSFKGGNYNLGKLKDSDHYIFYKSSDFDGLAPLPCYADEIAQSTVPKEITTTQKMDESNCVGLYVETALDMFTAEGSVTAVTDLVVLMFTEVFALYTNESINMNLNELLVWDVEDPYDATGPGGYLNDLVANVPSSAGDLVHLLSYDVLGGVAYLDQLCGGLNYGFSGIFSTYNDVPAYSWTIEVITHEIGHNLGSPHTHACAWNGDNTAIDGCGPEAGYSEGCDADLPDAGTIMSYCHLVSGVGIDFNLGFGTQPGDLIRDEVYNASCLSICSDCETIGDPCDDGDVCTVGDEYNTLCECIGIYVDADNDGFCVGDDVDDNDPCVPVECPPCFEITIEITLDNYPEETSWEIVNASGNVVASGGTYGSEPDGSTVTETACLEEACYDFIIYDSYGDGICCAYGDGAYSVMDQNGNVVASGGDFDDSETTNFCITDNPCVDEGLPCEDGDVCTTGEVYDANCNCVGGVFTDADDDGFCVGDDPNDNDPCIPDDSECGGEPCTEIDNNDVEVGWGIWNDGGADAARSNNAAYANTGNFSFLIKDNTSTSVITSDPMDLSGYVEVIFDFNFLATGFNNSSQDFWLQLSTDGGASFTNVKEWAFNDAFVNNSRVFENVLIEEVFTSNTVFRFRCDATANNDKIYLDDIMIQGCDSSSAACDDGIQNGGETEIDCGGPNCSTCEGCFTKDANDLEGSLGIWIDGGVDARRNDLDQAFANSGVFCVRLQDDTDESTITTGNMDMSGYDYINISFSYITSSIESGEGFLVQYSTDGGSTFVDFGSWELTTDFENGVREDAYAEIFGSFTSTTQFRIRADGSNNSDRIYIDDILIEGCYDVPNIEPESNVDSRSLTQGLLSFEIMPNPVTSASNLTINIESEANELSMQVFNVFGQLVNNTKLKKAEFKNYQLNTSSYAEGTYIVRIGNNGKFELKKLIVLN